MKNKNSLIYFDPPYFNHGSELYMNYFNYNDHLKLSEVINELNYNWIVSYDNVEEIKNFYKKFAKYIELKIRYSAENHNLASEILFNSKNLILPQL